MGGKKKEPEPQPPWRCPQGGTGGKTHRVDAARNNPEFTMMSHLAKQGAQTRKATGTAAPDSQLHLSTFRPSTQPMPPRERIKQRELRRMAAAGASKAAPAEVAALKAEVKDLRSRVEGWERWASQSPQRTGTPQYRHRRGEGSCSTVSRSARSTASIASSSDCRPRFGASNHYSSPAVPGWVDSPGPGAVAAQAHPRFATVSCTRSPAPDPGTCRRAGHASSQGFSRGTRGNGNITSSELFACMRDS
eukprot:Hpha_TRINITY_DN1446_c0_g1::TRINITY_DN1446_c0_g1_i1::g.9600::m.9600